MAYPTGVPTLRPIRRACGVALAGALYGAAGCDEEASTPPDAERAQASVSGIDEDGSTTGDDAPEAAPQAEAESDGQSPPTAKTGRAKAPPSRPPRTEAEAEAEAAEAPIGRRVTQRALMIYAEPRFDTDFRGKLPRREAFALFEKVEGDERCEGDGWGRVGVSAFVCLEHTEPTKDAPVKLPTLAKGQLTPFYYARRDKRRGEDHDPPRWPSRAALAAGKPATDALAREHDYAFVRRRRTSDGVLLTDSAFRVVREADVKRMEPSDFAGRDLGTAPIPDGRVLAWSVVWRHSTVREEAHPEADEVGRVRFHEMLYVRDEPTARRGEVFYPLAEGEGWVSDDEIQRFVPMDRSSAIAEGELWLDVELEEQTLAIMQGDEPVFVTLISSGSHKHPTPPGIYRLTSKMGYSDMRSRADEDEPYHVEAVPWVMYFDGRYALHGTFWHNRFGRRTSHGCVNLSAKDARRVYESTAPHPPGGWLSIYEHPEDPGTTIRIRKGVEEPPDRR